MGVYRIGRALKGVGFVAAMSVVVSCTTLVDNYGYVPTEMQLQEISVGQDTRQTVAEKVGAPPLEDFRRDDVWYYIASKVETYTYHAPVETDRQVVVIRFTDGGTVSNIERFGLDAGEVVVISRRVTDQAVPDIGFLRGILNSTTLRPGLPPQETL